MLPKLCVQAFFVAKIGFHTRIEPCATRAHWLVLTLCKNVTRPSLRERCPPFVSSSDVMFDLQSHSHSRRMSAKVRRIAFRMFLFTGLLWVISVFFPHKNLCIPASLGDLIHHHQPPLHDVSLAGSSAKQHKVASSHAEDPRIKYIDPFDITRHVYYGEETFYSFANWKGHGVRICLEKLRQTKSFEYPFTARTRKIHCVLSDILSFSTGRRAKLFLLSFSVRSSGPISFLTTRRFTSNGGFMTRDCTMCTRIPILRTALSGGKWNTPGKRRLYMAPLSN